MCSKLNHFAFKATLFLLFSLVSIPYGWSGTATKTNRSINLKIENGRLTDIFERLESETSYKFSYGQGVIADKQTYSIDHRNQELEVVMDDLAAKAKLSYNIAGQLVMVKKLANPDEEQKSVKTARGRVVDENGESLPGVNIVEKGTTNGTVTDLDGNYTINLSGKSQILVFSFIGLESQEIIASETLNVTMKAESKGLDEVVVVGYGSQEKKDVTGAIATIEPKDFKQGITTSADNLLQGKVAGVRIINSSGEPGGGVDVQIRGLGSIRSGSTPLFVVDGVPLSNNDVTPTGGSIGFGSSSAKNPLNFLNTSDIESINVLKDASAAAIYGARGSNGVVLITTKKGKKGEGTISVNSYAAVSELPKKIDLLSADEYREAVGDESSYNHGSGTDWQDEVFRQAITTNTELSFSKQTKSGSYYASVGHIDQEGIIENSSFKRISARLNAEESFLPDNRLKVKLNLAVSQMNETGVPSSDDAGSNGQLITHMLMANPTQSVFDSEGNYTNFNLTQNFNPMYLLYLYEDETNTLRTIGNIEASFRIFKGLTYKINYAVDRSTSERNTTYYKNETIINPNGVFAQSNLDNSSELIEHYLTWAFTSGQHKLDVLGGFSYQKFKAEETGFSVEGLEEKGVGIKPKYNPDYTSYTSSDISGSAQENELQSYFARANYTFASKYMLTASLRADGSTRFGEDKKYGYFPSFALGWNLSEENFMKNQSVFDNLKMRLSWGQTGNQEVPNKITKASYSLSSGNGYNLVDGTVTNGITVNRTANPDLHWEVVTQYDFGFDFELLNGKLYGSLDYYNKTTTDAILNITAPVLSPTDDVWKNVDAKIINKGVEFTLGYHIIKHKDLSWSVDINGTTLANKIKDLPVSEMYSGSISGPGQSGVMANIYKSNYEIGSFYLLKQLGFDEDGAEIYQDSNNDGSIDSDDRVIVEGALPNFMYGLNSQLNWKSFDFSFSIIGQSGAYLFNNTNFTATNINNLQSDRNVLKEYYNSGADSGNSPQISTYYLEKSDFVRLNSARLGYNLNTSKIKWLSGLTVYVTGQNLLTITKYNGFDPLANSNKESDGNQSVGIDYTSYPNARTYMLGLTLKL
ncbi:SusC/RagA family TonB-linked outer membrane protein [Mangrovibacterium diazotrophicum]|uniref:Iron complex outermembrane receptor protein n=1 Tax=Mangrovibacterium diazotrophicum TaxID=1261403 RepID=A0A419WAC5_9BACT|nr:TonB-dependent receptor [Mangrovibacterium diazotrophicum]RKD92403.1 iron complex outermembrane receptor protein [Mangrovibacterium diazotrophicum]